MILCLNSHSVQVRKNLSRFTQAVKEDSPQRREGREAGLLRAEARRRGEVKGTADKRRYTPMRYPQGSVQDPSLHWFISLSPR